MLNINPREKLCAFPAGVVECQCLRYRAPSLERLGVCSPDAFDASILRFFNKLKKREGEMEEGKKESEGKKNLIRLHLKERSHEQKRRFDLLV